MYSRMSVAGSGSSEFTQRTSKAAKSFILVYLFLSLINFLLLVLAGVQLIEALCLTFTTISTGGLTIINSNMIGYSDVVQWITVLFMFLGGTNFYLHFRAIYLRERHVYRRNSEFRMMVVWFIAISAVIFLFKISAQVKAGNGLDVGNLYDSFKNVLFTTVSLGTTTGYYTEDFTTWPSQCMLILMTVALIGTSSSSTSGSQAKIVPVGKWTAPMSSTSTAIFPITFSVKWASKSSLQVNLSLIASYLFSHSVVGISVSSC